MWHLRAQIAFAFRTSKFLLTEYPCTRNEVALHCGLNGHPADVQAHQITKEEERSAIAVGAMCSGARHDTP